MRRGLAGRDAVVLGTGSMGKLAARLLREAPVLDPQLSGEPQLGAVEPDQPGRYLPGPVQLVDQLIHGQVTTPGEGDDVAVVSVGVGVTGELGHQPPGCSTGSSARVGSGTSRGTCSISRCSVTG
jgi:hypothetical protein